MKFVEKTNQKTPNFLLVGAKMMMFAIAIILVITACSEDDNTPNPSGGNNIGAITNFTATTGDGQVVLTWNAPSDNGGSGITGYKVTRDNWATKVTKTANELSHTYIGLTNGTEYTFKVRAVNENGAGAESSATAIPTAGATGGDDCILTKEMVQNGGTLPKCTYTLKDGITITGTQHNPLTILPGTIIKFDKNQYGQISFLSTPQNIIAVGTENEPIIFTSASATPKAGDWGMVDVGGGSHFEHCTFEYGAKEQNNTNGENDNRRGLVPMLKILYTQSEKPTIKNCIFRYSELGALIMQAEGFAAFDNNRFSNCGETIPLNENGLQWNAFPLSASKMHYLTGIGNNNVFNTSKGIGVGEYDELAFYEFTMKNPETPYYLFNQINLNAERKLTIEAGTHIIFTIAVLFLMFLIFLL